MYEKEGNSKKKHYKIENVTNRYSLLFITISWIMAWKEIIQTNDSDLKINILNVVVAT